MPNEVALGILEIYESKLGSGSKLDDIQISAEDIAERLNLDLPDGKKTNSKKVGKILKVLGFDRNKKRVKTPLATNDKKGKIVRALATNSILIAKILRRYTIIDDETYPLLRGVVASVASHNGEGDNNKIMSNSVTYLSNIDNSALSSCHLPHLTHLPQNNGTTQKKQGIMEKQPDIPDKPHISELGEGKVDVLPDMSHISAHPESPNKNLPDKSGMNQISILWQCIDRACMAWEKKHFQKINSSNLIDATFNLKPDFPDVTADDLASKIRRYARIPEPENNKKESLDQANDKNDPVNEKMIGTVHISGKDIPVVEEL